MGNRLKASIFAVVAVLALAGVVLAQTAAKPGAGAGKAAAGAKPAPAPRTADGKPDLSGVWGIVDRATGVKRTAREESIVIEKLYGELKSEKPVLTPWAQERLAYKPMPMPIMEGLI